MIRPAPLAPTLPEIDRALAQALRDNVASAAACVLSAPRAGEPHALLHQAHVGTARPGAPPIRLVAPALFDVGALTGTLVTTTLAALLVGRGRLDLARPLGKFVGAGAAPSSPGSFAASPWRDIPLESLLDHTSGLPDAGPTFAALATAHAAAPAPVRSAKEQLAVARAPAPSRLAAGRDLGGPLDAAQTAALRAALQAVAPVAAPGTQVAYSALNLLALGWALEIVLGQPLDQAFANLVVAPLGLSGQMHFYRCGPAGPWHPPPRQVGASQVAYGGDCPVRRRPLVAEPRCPIAYLLGGVAGHAGLFAGAPAVATLLQAHLAALDGRGTLLGAGVLNRFWTRSKKVADSPFALGWQVAARHNGMAPGRWHSRSVGQVDPGGCAAFVDPAFGVTGVLLSNGAAGAAADKDARWQTLRLRVFDAMASEGQFARKAARSAQPGRPGRPRG